MLGFTLIELIMVIVMLGVLAVVAAPRIFNSSDFYARGFHDVSMANLRYAQKTAIAQRRNVCVYFSSSSITLRIGKTAKDDPVPDFDCYTSAKGLVLMGPDGAASVSAKPGVTYSGGVAPANFNFDPLGQPVNNSNVALTSSQSISVETVGKSITVEAISGYVHD